MALFSSKKKKEDNLPPLDWPPAGDQGGQGGQQGPQGAPPQQNPPMQGGDQFPYQQQPSSQTPSFDQGYNQYPQDQQGGQQYPAQDYNQQMPPPQPQQPQQAQGGGYGQPDYSSSGYSSGGYSADDERIEEIAEAIIDEKWQELVKDVKKVIDWKDTVESKMDHLEQEIKDLKTSMDNMQKALFGKIADYDKSISDVGTEIKAMEKVFQKILPTLTESVNKLDRMSKGSGKGKR